MTARFSLRNRSNSRQRRVRRASAQFPLRMEALEDRTAPSVLGMTSVYEGRFSGSDSVVVGATGAWTAPSDVPWLRTSSSGTGNGLATFTWDANTGLNERVGTLTIAGETLTVIQVGSGYNAATDDNGLTATATFTLTVNNVAPTIAISGASSVNKGAVYTLTLGDATDPADDTVTQYIVHRGDGTSDTYTTGGAKTHVYADGGTYAITVDLLDEDGTHTNRANALSVNVTVNGAPTLTVPAAQTAYEDVDLAIRGIAVGDPDGGNLTVTLSVGHGTLTLGTTAGLTVSGIGTGAVTFSGGIADLNTALAGLLYRGLLNYSGADALSINVSDGSLSTSGSVAITVTSAFQQAADLQARVEALRVAGVLTKRQADTLIKSLKLKGNKNDAGNVQQFLLDVASLRNAGILTPAQADELTEWGNILLLSVTRR
jgi:hypothetical protein